ncbi:hypothetical protein ZOD2009_11905 [Haladaptatus paucihalophilus DX253]|uniref:Uncharacterized protein n=1 Tax=Haladaptatus paucihalophilus DX253 TaxID=797209 RepID=E7QUA1_HALPU|nr:hypothetical protein ZOD2009_11905 [Haladaptatus paucihalophilus DX253]
MVCQAKYTANRDTFEPGVNIYSCMSKIENYRLFVRDLKKWAVKKAEK